MAAAGSTSDEEVVTNLAEFQKRVVAEHLYDSDLHDTHTLKRFLSVNGGDVEKSLTMWRENLEWRESVGAERLLHEAVLSSEQTARYMHLFPHGLHGQDKLSHPILIYRVGQIDGAGLLSEFSEQVRVKCHASMMELVMKVVFPSCSITAGKRVDRILTIYDLAGVGFSALSNFTAVYTPLIKSQAAHYPETNFKMLFVNAPFGFQSVFKGAMSMVSRQVQEKMSIYGAGFGKNKDLLAILDPAILPEYLGGKEKQRISDWRGAWTELHHQFKTQTPSHPKLDASAERISGVGGAKLTPLKANGPPSRPDHDHDHGLAHMDPAYVNVGYKSPFASIQNLPDGPADSPQQAPHAEALHQAISSLGYSDSFKSCISPMESRYFSAFLASPSNRFAPGQGLYGVQEGELEGQDSVGPPLMRAGSLDDLSDDKAIKCLTLKQCFWWCK